MTEGAQLPVYRVNAPYKTGARSAAQNTMFVIIDPDDTLKYKEMMS